jgi:DNA-directed RNA polymerase beta subunit
MKLAKLLVGAAVVAGLTASVAMADYNKGFKYYNKYIKRKAGLKSTQMLKALGVNTTDELKALFKDNAKPLIEKLQKINPKAAKGVEKIVKKHKLKDLEDFLIGIMNGKIPAGCS